MNRILIRNAAEVNYLLKNMADNESKDVEDMMAILAQMEEKAKNMERLVVLRRQVESGCKKPEKIRDPTQNPRDFRVPSSKSDFD